MRTRTLSPIPDATVILVIDVINTRRVYIVKGIPDLKDGPSHSHPADEAHVFVLGATRVRFNVVRVGLTGHWAVLPARVHKAL